jgi:hypothetical protein
MRIIGFVAVVALTTGALGCSPSPTYRTAGGAALGGTAGVLGGAESKRKPHSRKTNTRQASHHLHHALGFGSMTFQRVCPVPHNKTGRLHGGNFALLVKAFARK